MYFKYIHNIALTSAGAMVTKCEHLITLTFSLLYIVLPVKTSYR